MTDRTETQPPPTRSRSVGRRTLIYRNRMFGVLEPEQAESRKIHRLPARASEYYGQALEAYQWGPTLRTILVGTRDCKSPLYTLWGLEETVVKHIFSYVAAEWADHVTLTIPASCVGRVGTDIVRYNNGRRVRFLQSYEILNRSIVTSGEFVAFSPCGKSNFPPPADRNVNMMPFVFGDESSLPEDLKCYYGCIQQCNYSDQDIGKVGYLTVHECHVEAGSAQRRDGLHIESPGVFYGTNSPTFSPAREHGWGLGMFFGPDEFEGGIFMASSVANTSEVWDALVDKNVRGIVDHHGGCEHLRRLIGPGTKLEADELIWMTDRTPHEALPQEAPGHRQFFRVVTPQISHWYADHSTPNPLVSVPDNVVVVYGNKFAGSQM